MRLLLAVLVTAVMVAVINNTMVTVLLPQIQQEFSASAAAAGWVVTAFALAFAVFTPFHGRASDVFGIRGVFVAGLVLFLVGSLLAALARGMPVLLTARALQGVGGAAIPALASVTVARVLPAGRRGLAFGLILTGVGAGQGAGPVLGGLVAQFAGWRAPFVGTAVLAVPVLLGAIRTMPTGADADLAGWRRLDLLGGLLLGSAVALGLNGLTQGQGAGFTAVSSWGSLLGAAALGAAFAARIRHAPAPFAPPNLFRNAAFLSAMAVGFLTLFGYLATLVLVPQLVSGVNDLDTGQVGLVLLPGAVAVAALSAVAGRWSDRVGSRGLVTAGLAVLIATALLLSTLAGHSVLLIAGAMLGMGLGLALISSPIVNAAATALSAEQSGVGLGLHQGAFFLGGGSGAAVLGAVLSARDGGSAGWNPLHTGAAAGFSDAFLVIAAVLLLALLGALRLPGRPPAAPRT